MDNAETKVVQIHDAKIDREYMLWLGEIKARYRNAQIKAAVNAELLCSGSKKVPRSTRDYRIKSFGI